MLGTTDKEELRQKISQLKRPEAYGGDPDYLYSILSQLEQKELQEILYDEYIWLEDHQARAMKDWSESIIMMLGGRGSGKTSLGVQWIRSYYKRGIKGQISLMAPTSGEVRDIIVYNGFLELCDPEDDLPEFEPSKSRIVFPDGSVARMFSAERGNERIRGSNNELCWIDELGSIPDKDVLDQLLLTLRVGASKCLITTTPRNTEAIRDLYSRAVFDNEESRDDKDVRIITASTRNNEHNLSKAFRNQIVAAYAGTRLGKQELEGHLLFEAEGAMWSIDLISNQTLKDGWSQLPKLSRVAIGVDPATSNKKSSDLTGIVVCALGEDGNGYVLKDDSDRYSPQGWAQKVIELYNHFLDFAPTTVVVERNQGGEIVGEMLRREKPLMPIDEVFHTKDKLSRAQPVAMLYEKGQIFHIQPFNELEGEMSSYEGTPGQKSPDRMDAMVMSMTHLIAGTRRVTKVTDLVL